MWHIWKRSKPAFQRFFCQSLYLILRTLQALNFPVRWLRTTVNSTSSPVWSSKPSCTSFTWKNNFLLSPTSYVIKPNYDDNKFREKKMSLPFTQGGTRATQGKQTNQYLIFDALDQCSALRYHNTRHLLPSLSYCANLELDRFSFLKTVCFACHTHDSKRYFLAFTSPWKK